MKLLTDDEKLLYDSCADFAGISTFLLLNSGFNRGEKIIFCRGNEDITELCNRCPYYSPHVPNSQNLRPL